jgi:hypothetical protein
MFCPVLIDDRWVVENQIGKRSLAIDDCDSKQSVYVYGCKDSVIQVNGNRHLSLDVHSSLCFKIWSQQFYSFRRQG